MKYVVEDRFHGRTIKQYLRFMQLSQTQIKHLKTAPDGILVNGVRVTVRHELQSGETLTLAVEDKASSEHIVATKMPFVVLYEDDEIIALNKPPKMPTHPSHGHYEDTLANGLAYYFQERGIPFVFRAISRLDKDTSGVVLVAKTARAAGKCNEAHLQGIIEKKYLAILCGQPVLAQGEIQKRICRSTDSIIRRAVSDTEGDISHTIYRTIACQNTDNGVLSLVLATPVTGRTHQLRVHFASLGSPVCDDFLYGDGVSYGIGRQALHAYSLAFPHPMTGEKIILHAPLPQDMAAFLKNHMNSTLFGEYLS